MKLHPIARAHVRGTLYALLLTLASILIFAFAVQMAGLNDSVIGPATQVFKTISIFIGVMAVARVINKRAWMHGAILGLTYTALIFLLLSIIYSNFSITSGFLIEAAFAAAIGLFSAMLLRLRKRDA